MCYLLTEEVASVTLLLTEEAVSITYRRGSNLVLHPLLTEEAACVTYLQKRLRLLLCY